MLNFVFFIAIFYKMKLIVAELQGISPRLAPLVIGLLRSRAAKNLPQEIKIEHIKF